MASRVWNVSELPQRRIWTPREIQVMAENQAGEGLKACAKFFQTVLRQTISVQAPYVVHFSKTGKPSYRALTKATPGAPPRRVSGNLMRRVAMDFDDANNVAYVFTDVDYGAKHEKGDHPWMLPTLKKNLEVLGQVAGGAMTVKVH